MRNNKIDTLATIVLTGLFLLLATLWIRLCDIDLQVQRFFWDASTSTWRHAKDPVMLWIYNFGVIPAVLVAMTALVVLLMGIGRQDIARYRKVTGHLLLTLLIGAGVITNLLLKGMWGRPRPTQLIEFGGSQPFEPILTWFGGSFGKSFPCGHATMGFFFFAVALVIPKRMPILRVAVAVFAVMLGAALGWARSAQGGHFLSDTLWSAAVMWFVAVGLFRWMRLGESRIYVPKKPFRVRVPTWVMVTYVPVVGLALLLCLLGTPYKDSYQLPEVSRKVRRIVVDVESEVKLVRGDVFRIDAQCEGFGMPNSSQRFSPSVVNESELQLKGHRKGFFTELRVVLTITAPEGQDVEIVCQAGSRLVVAR